MKDLKEKISKPGLFDCMECSYFKGLHPLLSKVICDFKPTSDDMRHRSIENDIVNCPMIKFGLDWRTVKTNNHENIP